VSTLTKIFDFLKNYKNKSDEKNNIQQDVYFIQDKVGDKLLETLRSFKEKPSGWGAFSIENYEVIDTKNSAWDNKENTLATTKNKLCWLFPQANKIYWFLLSDYSSVIVTNNLTNQNMMLAEAALPSLLYGSEAKNKISFYDFTIAWDKFFEICDAKVVKKDSKVIIEKEIAPLDVFSIEMLGLKKSLQSKTKSSQFKTLIIEDDISSSHILGKILEKFNPSLAHTALQGILNYDRFVPDIVFLDIGLPDASGLDVLKRLTMDDPAAFIVVLSANSSKNNLKLALEYGAKGFITKPFTMEKLANYVDKCKKQKTLTSQ
jgi:two-component system chemotaxis response regulator CheY